MELTMSKKHEQDRTQCKNSKTEDTRENTSGQSADTKKEGTPCKGAKGKNGKH